jgi:hypothetical protein
MITVGSASLARGYSAWDHLLDDRPLRAMIGREYPSYAAAARAAHRLLAGTQDRRCAGAPVWILDEEGTGSPYWDDGSVA